MQRTARDAGFTLIELILVLVLIGFLTGLATPFVMDVLDRIQRNSALNQIASFLRATRSQAVSKKIPIVFQGDLTGHRYWWVNPETEETSPIHPLTPKVRFAGFDDGKDSIEQGIFSIIFYPLGNNTGGVIYLKAKEAGKNETGFRLSIDPITGRSQVRHES